MDFPAYVKSSKGYIVFLATELELSFPLYKHIIQLSPKNFIKSISELCFNILQLDGPQHLSSSELTIVQKNWKLLKILASKHTSVERKRKFLAKKSLYNKKLLFSLCTIFKRLWLEQSE